MTESTAGTVPSSSSSHFDTATQTPALSSSTPSSQQPSAPGADKTPNNTSSTHNGTPSSDSKVSDTHVENPHQLSSDPSDLPTETRNNNSESALFPEGLQIENDSSSTKEEPRFSFLYFFFWYLRQNIVSVEKWRIFRPTSGGSPWNLLRIVVLVFTLVNLILWMIVVMEHQRSYEKGTLQTEMISFLALSLGSFVLVLLCELNTTPTSFEKTNANQEQRKPSVSTTPSFWSLLVRPWVLFLLFLCVVYSILFAWIQGDLSGRIPLGIFFLLIVGPLMITPLLFRSSQKKEEENTSSSPSSSSLWYAWFFFLGIAILGDQKSTNGLYMLLVLGLLALTSDGVVWFLFRHRNGDSKWTTGWYSKIWNGLWWWWQNYSWIITQYVLSVIFYFLMSRWTFVGLQSVLLVLTVVLLLVHTFSVFKHIYLPAPSSLSRKWTVAIVIPLSIVLPVVFAFLFSDGTITGNHPSSS